DISSSIYETYYYCTQCEICTKTIICSCGIELTKQFSYSSITQQMQNILSNHGTYTKIIETIKQIKLNEPHTNYEEIIHDCPKSSATLLINSDGIEILKGVGVWPIMLVINELPISERFLLKNIIIPVVWSTSILPTTSQLQASIKLIVDELIYLEQGYEFYIPELDRTLPLHVYTIFSCNDKPAQAKMENIKQFMAEYGCGLCYTRGSLYRFSNNTQYTRLRRRQQSGFNQNLFKSQPPIRVYPYEKDLTLRTNETHDNIIMKMEQENLADEQGHL
ncbi:unnamed protein product, partial [Didymodactylos carnosus]